MAQRKINRKNQDIQYKGRHENIPEEIEEEEEADAEYYEGNKVKLNTGFLKTRSRKGNDAATVEVTVKVKKRRDKDKQVRPKKLAEREFCKGSWGDLLLASSSKTSVAGRDGRSDKKSKDSGSQKSSPKENDDVGSRRPSSKGSNEHSPLCHKIPITDELYLETHTHIRKSQSADADVKAKNKPKKTTTTTAATIRQRALLRENEELRDQVDRLLREIEVTRSRPRPLRPASRTSSGDRKEKENVARDADSESFENSHHKKSKTSTQSIQTSTSCLKTSFSAVESPKQKAIEIQCQTDELDFRAPAPPPPPAQNARRSVSTGSASASSTSAPPLSSEIAVQQMNLRLEKENEELRGEAGKLVAEMNRARAEYLECCNTMKELHQIAEVLKRDNFQKNQQQQTLESKLFQALAENREMREVLESLADKQKTSLGLQDDQLAKIRNVIQDVKLTIAQEMSGLGKLSTTLPSFLLEKDSNSNADLDSAFRFEGESFLNDTNASEIQRILLEPPEMRRGGNQGIEDRSSSTQYLNIGGYDRQFRPSPLAVTKYSPRVSTPNCSNLSLNLSESDGGNRGAGDTISYLPVHHPVPLNPLSTLTSHSQTKSVEEYDEWKKLQDQVSRSFIPVRNELSHCSTSSYSSSSSSPNNFK